MPKLPLPFRVTQPFDPEAIQGNFDELAKQYPLSRKHISIPTPVVVGSGGTAPAFQGAWTNFDTATFQGLRFWKDVVGVVHVEGVVKSGAVPSTIFRLPTGYLPSNGHRYPSITNTGLGWVDVVPTGNVVAQSGGNSWFTVEFQFKQES